MKSILNGQLVDLTDYEIEELATAAKDYKNSILPVDVRGERNRLLSTTDWMALSDNTMTPEWAAYRQALRDITEQAGFPYTVEWPTKP